MENFVLDEDAEERGQDQDNQTDKKNTPAGSEVIFALFLKKRSIMSVSGCYHMQRMQRMHDKTA